MYKEDFLFVCIVVRL